jgi:ferritin-like metal-binding protein YciE
MSLQERIKDRWQRLRNGFGSATPAIDSIEALYRTELHDLHSAELQASALADEIWVTIRNEPLAQRVSEYAGELRSHSAKLDSLISQIDASTRESPDEAMHALVHGASEMAELCSDEVRDAALVAALQRIIHTLSADYGTLATHAAALGRSAEADQFSQYADSNQVVEGELSELAKTALKVDAASAKPS